MMIRIVCENNLTASLKVLFSLFFHEIVFVGERPPDIPIRRETTDDIAQIMIVLSRSHSVKAPVAFVIRMKKDQVSFNAEVAKIANSFFEVLKEFGVKPGKIPIAWRGAFERIEQRLICIPIVVLGKNAKTNFVERRRSERLQSLLLKRRILVNPRIAGRAELFERFAVGICKMKCVRDVNRAVVFYGRKSEQHRSE